MCKSIHRVLMAPVMRDADSFKWATGKKKKKKKLLFLSHTCRVGRKQFKRGCVESVFVSRDGANIPTDSGVHTASARTHAGSFRVVFLFLRTTESPRRLLARRAPIIKLYTDPLKSRSESALG